MRKVQRRTRAIRESRSAEGPQVPLRLDLGCGQNKAEGFIGVDIVAGPGVDRTWDLGVSLPWPWKDNSVDEARAIHFFEHLTGHQRIHFMNELHRVLKPGAQALIVAPYWASMRAVQDPTHEWPPVSEMQFLYFNRKWREDNKLDHYPITADFDFTYGYQLGQTVDGWPARAQEARDFAIRNYMNVVADLQVVLTKREPNA